ncbi:MAG: phenylacetate--CoA ligase family protein [Candidatus Latescibacteria bacterium]|nr:phenylacetate--CoA ligase family protein [Candidatus Latescibacterota bacterium]NIM21499.1 phenylacetate--CoA ligase family protein [Candidatus Latescibacterota bacterium]NIM65670.1 phenylacetate--CoA ligase family protein [Candidatus Latescibacterota bacterium]NIO02052.1 phenylacetate--CoA ligase family protein [Candidatus Latescibacterota bacterium]NIO28864.1 phenylacetate--CoA ligase family protein [Candidatus Latescibacterota bacterium]
MRRRRTFHYLNQFEKDQWLSEEELKEIQWKKLKPLLEHAYQHVPYYREQFENCGFHPEQMQDLSDISKIPILTKKNIQDNQQSLLADNYKDKPLLENWTGGSTGEPTRFKFDHRTYEMRMAYSARCDRWSGWDYGIKEFYIWGVRDTGDAPTVTAKKTLHNLLLRRKVVNCYTFSRDTFPRYVKEFNRFKPDMIISYTSPLYNLARYIHENKLDIYTPKSIIATAEQLYPFQRELIEEVFQAPVFNRYGSREVMNIAMECDKHEGLHLNIDNLLVEIIKDNQPVEPGELGEIVITDLNNYVMPFIRCKLGDLAVPSIKKCSCRRGLPLLQEVAGRTFDTLTLRDGRCITGLLFTFYMQKFTGVSQFQVIQKDLDTFIVNIVKNSRYKDSDTEDIGAELRQQLGANAKIDLHFVDNIPMQKSGKQRIVISEVPLDFGNE